MLTSVARHARATEVLVGLREEDSRLVLQVKDNGIGIKEEQIIDPKSLGLIGIRERIYALGDKVEISGIQGKGTIVIMTMPLNN